MKRIQLCGKRGKGLFALVDDEDYEKVSSVRWHYSSGRTPYPRCSLWVDGKIKNTTMHIYILGRKDGYVTDHIDGDTLNNQRSNLRYCSYVENARNRKVGKNSKSGYKGVYWTKGSQRPNGGWRQKPAWVASISIDGRQKLIGYYPTLKQAAIARAAKEVEVYGKFARPGTVL